MKFINSQSLVFDASTFEAKKNAAYMNVLNFSSVIDRLDFFFTAQKYYLTRIIETEAFFNT